MKLSFSKKQHEQNDQKYTLQHSKKNTTEIKQFAAKIVMDNKSKKFRL